MIRIKQCVIVLFLLLIVSFKGAANGDPVMRYSALTLSCTPQAVHIPEIKLSRENLEIKAYAKFAKVFVTYRLSNTSNKSFDRIDYGFPVDWYGSSGVSISYLDLMTESEQEYGWKDSYVKDIHFRIDGKELNWVCSKDTILVSGEEWLSHEVMEDWGEIDPDDPDRFYWEAEIEHAKKDFKDARRHDLCRKWYYTSFAFGPKQTRTLTVEYTIATNYSVSLHQKESIFKNNRSGLFFGTSEFGYDFAPSSYWGDGIVEDFDISFDMSSILSLEREYYNNQEMPFVMDPDFDSDLTMKKTRPGVWQCSKKNFDLTKAAPLRISYIGLGKEHEDITDLTLRRIPNNEFTVTKNGNPVPDISDGNIYTSARIQPDEKGTYHIKVDLNSRRKLLGILLYMGDNAKGTFIRSSVPAEARVSSSENSRELLIDDNWFSPAGKAPASFSYQDLTDSAEKFIMDSPSIYSYNRYYPYDYDSRNHLDISLLSYKGNVPYISEVVLLGEHQHETMFLEEEVDTKPYFGDSENSLTEYIENNFSMLDELRKDQSSYIITCEIDYTGKIINYHGTYNGHGWDNYLDENLFEMKLDESARQMIESMPLWNPATINKENVGCIASFTIK